MRTDRELLELAAKAAGLALADEVDSYLPGSRALWIVGPGGRDVVWQPLGDDGDALRLAVRLELDIMYRVVGGDRVEVLPPGGPLTVVRYIDDRLAATRRAIVDAAAGIGAKRAASQPHVSKGEEQS